MVRYAKSYFIENYPGDKRVLYVEGACNSDDEKPTENIAQGSIMTEVDTGDIYMFDEDAGEWTFFVSSKGE